MPERWEISCNWFRFGFESFCVFSFLSFCWSFCNLPFQRLRLAISLPFASFFKKFPHCFWLKSISTVVVCWSNCYCILVGVLGSFSFFVSSMGAEVKLTLVYKTENLLTETAAVIYRKIFEINIATQKHKFWFKIISLLILFYLTASVLIRW